MTGMSATRMAMLTAAALALTVICAADIPMAGAPEGTNLLANGGFEEPEFAGWSLVRAGDGEGRMELVDDAAQGRRAARVYAPNDRSWTFLRQHDLDVQVGETLVLSARVKSDTSRAKLVLTCGFLWGGSPSGHSNTRAHHSGSGEWETLRTRLEVTEMPVSAAIGFDYGGTDTSLLVDDVRLLREEDALAEDAAACAEAYGELSRRDDLPGWMRDAAVAHAERAGELVAAVRAAERGSDERAERIEDLREYAGTAVGLIAWVGDGAAAEGEPALMPETITLRGADGARATLNLLNIFGDRSVAVRLVADDMREDEDGPGIPVRLRTRIPAGERTLRASLGEGSVIVVPRGEVRQVELAARAPRRGEWSGPLTIQPLDRDHGGVPRTVTLWVRR